MLLRLNLIFFILLYTSILHASNYDDAQSAAKFGDFQKCVALLNDAITIDDDTRAYSALGQLYVQGFMVDKNIDLGMKYLNIAMDRNFVEAFMSAGLMHAVGDHVSKNITIAVNYWEKAYELGSCGAAYNLSSVYDPKNKDNNEYADMFKFQNWLYKSAECGHPEGAARFAFLLMSDNKLLVKEVNHKDRQIFAYRWALVGKNLGNSLANDLCLFMLKQWDMSESEKQEAESFASIKIKSFY